MCSLQKSGKSELQNFDRIYSRHLPVPCNTATRDPDTWGNNEMKGKKHSREATHTKLDGILEDA